MGPFLIAAERGKLQLVRDVVEKSGEILQTGTYQDTYTQTRKNIRPIAILGGRF